MKKDWRDDSPDGIPDPSIRGEKQLPPECDAPGARTRFGAGSPVSRDGGHDLARMFEPTPMDLSPEISAYLASAPPEQIRRAAVIGAENALVFAEAGRVMRDVIQCAADLLRAGQPNRALAVLEQIERCSHEAGHG